MEPPLLEVAQPAKRKKQLRGVSPISKIYENNKASSFTENMEQLQKSFDYASNADANWTYPELSLLYGSSIYEAASEAQKRALNHIYWVCFYNYVMGGEITTMVANQICCGAFYPIGGYEVVCHSLDLETSQERTHVEAFRNIGRVTEKALFGETIFERPMPNYLDASHTKPQVQGRGPLSKIPLMSLQSVLGQSPFVASQYFVARGLRNIQAKVKEYQHSAYGKELENAGKPVPAPTLISHNHCFDEGYHTATSKFISHEIYRDFKQPNAFEKLTVNAMVRSIQFSMNELSVTVPGIFSQDEQYFSTIYKMLQKPLFGMSSQEALNEMGKAYCQEHEGYHVAARYHARALAKNTEFVQDLDHLADFNRELKIMSTASIEKAIRANTAAFRRFRKKTVKAEGKSYRG
ncbi:MAG: hypothetical protein ACFB16_04690 [Phormidesmis sp.]